MSSGSTRLDKKLARIRARGHSADELGWKSLDYAHPAEEACEPHDWTYSAYNGTGHPERGCEKCLRVEKCGTPPEPAAQLRWNARGFCDILDRRMGRRR
jgi:hypothetical protein